MVPLRVVVCFALLAAAAATDVKQCPGNIHSLHKHLEHDPLSSRFAFTAESIVLFAKVLRCIAHVYDNPGQ